MLLLTLFVNTILAKQLPALEGLILVLHVVGFFAIMIPLVHLAPTKPASYVFGDFTNLSGYGSDGLSWFIGLVPSVTLFIGQSASPQHHLSLANSLCSGFDGACHMGK